MLEETIAKIEARIRDAGSMSEAQRAELTALVGRLRGEIGALSSKHREQAESLATFAHASTQEATRENRNPETLRHSLGGLTAAASEFETTHPQLTGVVKSLSTMLANMGI